MVIRSAVAGVAGIMMVIAAGANPAAAQGACPAGCGGATNWDGFWLGVGVGGSFDMIGQDYVRTANDQHSEVINGNVAEGYVLGRGNDDSRGAAGFFGSVGIGFDRQVNDRFVLGAFGDFDFGRSEHTETDSWYWTENGTQKSGSASWGLERNSTWTIGARLGLLTSNSSMLYGLVGYSWTDMDVSVHAQSDGITDASFASENLDFSGLVLGVGLEHNLGGGFSLKGEYRYTNFGDESFNPGVELGGESIETDTFDLDSHSVRLTLDYKFARDREVIEEVSYKDIPPAPSYSAPYK